MSEQTLGQAVSVVHGQAAPASPSTLGSRQGLSWPTPQTMDVLPVRPVDEFAESNRTRGGRKNRKALSNLREAVHSPVYWRTPQAQEAGAKVETLFTKDGAPAMPGQRAYRKTPSGNLALQSQTINQQVEMVQNWATPSCMDTLPPRSPEALARAKTKGGCKNLREEVATWPTPSASCDQGGPSGLAGGSGNRAKLNAMLPEAEAKAMGCGKLNPRWVETLMGLPIGWTMPSCIRPVTIAPTSCDSSATALCQPAQSERSDFLLAS